jgi:DMSO/TMAO reductase YedYZ molybdopterin-dependent catalytic subunit
VTEPVVKRPDTRQPGLSRRGLLLAGATAAGIVGVTTVGQTLTPLHDLALLAPRDPDDGPDGVPINRTAAAAGVRMTAVDPDYRFSVGSDGAVSFAVADLEAMPLQTMQLPISCVEGWSRGASWRGIPLRAMLSLAGLHDRVPIRLISIESRGSYRTSTIDPEQADRALLALFLNGHRLTVDHGYPMRLIAPDRPGVLQTKWLRTIEYA